MFDTSRLGAWGDLTFFQSDLAGLESQIEGAFLPPPALTFRALEMTQPDDVKVVILGQDPYHTVGKADGLAFSIPDDFGGRLDSLGNIFKELQSDLEVNRTKTSLDDWAAQGVLLFNALALSVAEGKAGSHRRLGWQKLTAQVLERLADRPRAYLLWGADAQAAGAAIDDQQNLKLLASHPSPMAARHSFLGSRPFSIVNDWLNEQGETSINWADPA